MNEWQRRKNNTLEKKERIKSLKYMVRLPKKLAQEDYVNAT